MKKLTAILAFMLLLASQSLWAAHSGPGDEPEACPMLERLELTKAQKVQVEAIMKQYQPQLRQSRDQVHAARGELQQAMQTGSEDKIRKAHRKLAAIQEDELVLRARMLNEVKPFLTDAQLRQLNEPPCPPKGHGRFFRCGGR